MRLPTISVCLIASIFSAGPLAAHQVDITMHEYFVYRDFVADLQGGAELELGKWDHHDAGGNWIEVPRVINGSVKGPGIVISGPFNGFRKDPGWTRVSVKGGYIKLELRGAEDDGRNRGTPGPWTGWVEVSGQGVPSELQEKQYLSYRITLDAGQEVTQVDLSMSVDIRDEHPRLLVDDLAELKARCEGALSHQCSMNEMFANSSHLTSGVNEYSESQAARVAKVMAFQYMVTGDEKYGDRVRQLLLKLASYDRDHWSDLRDSIQDLGLGWIGLSWMLALDWSFDALKEHPGDLQRIARGTVVFVDYLLEMYKHTDFNNHFYLGRSPVLLAGLALAGEGLVDADAERYVQQGFDFLFNHEHPALNSVAGDMGGWHESLGYFDGEMGYPVLVDMDGLRTAAGIDFFQDSSFWRTLPQWYLASTVPWDKTLIHWADQGKDRWAKAVDGSESEGKSTRQYLTGLQKNLARLGYPEADQAQYLLDDLIGVFYDSGGYAESYYKVNHLNDVLWYDPAGPKAGLPDRRLSLHFDSLGEVILREGNDPDDAMAMFACAWFRGGHQQADNGHFSIWYKGYLAVDSGYYDGWGSSHHFNYARRTIAHNTLTVTMPGETFSKTSHNDGGQSLGCNTTYYNAPAEDEACHACSMFLSTRTEPYFDFIGSDMTKSYNPEKVSLVTREFVWLRPDLFVVFDRVESKDPLYKKRFLLHGKARFQDHEGAYSVDDGDGRLWVATLLPQDAVVTQVGGQGHEWEVEGTNYPPKRGQEFAGSHRLEISPGSARSFDVFLHVLQVTGQGVSSMADSRLLQAGRATGVRVMDWFVWFGTRGRMDGLMYDAETGSTSKVVIGDLEPSTMYEVLSGADIQKVSSDQNGVLFFFDRTEGEHEVVVRKWTCEEDDCGSNQEEMDADLSEMDADVVQADSGDAPDSTLTELSERNESPPGRAGLEGGCGCGSSGGRGYVTVSSAWILLSLFMYVRRRNDSCMNRWRP